MVEVTTTKDQMRFQKVVHIAMPMNYDENIIKQLINGVSPNDLQANLDKFSTIDLLDHLIKKTGDQND